MRRARRRGPACDTPTKAANKGDKARDPAADRRRTILEEWTKVLHPLVDMNMASFVLNALKDDVKTGTLTYKEIKDNRLGIAVNSVHTNPKSTMMLKYQAMTLKAEMKKIVDAHKEIPAQPSLG